MNTDVQLLSAGEDAASRFDKASRWLIAFEKLTSRFRPDSDISMLNDNAGRCMAVSPLVFGLLNMSV